MDAGKETLGGGEKKLDDLFTYKKGDEATYFVFKGLGDQELDVGPSSGAVTASEKVEVATQGDETEEWRFWRSLKKKDRSSIHLPGK